MTTTVIDVAVAQALAADTRKEALAARDLLDVAVRGIDEADWPTACPEVIGAYEQVETILDVLPDIEP